MTTPMVTPSIPVKFYAINDMVGGRIADLITAYCITSLIGIPEAKPYLATVVRQGEFQDNPVQHRISILIYPEDPTDLANQPKESDSQKPRDEIFEISPSELGGGAMSWLRYTVDIKCYFSLTGENRNDARRIGQWVFGRINQAIRENRGLDLTDDFGEHALQMEVTRKNMIEGGGPGAFNWTGQIWISAAIDATSTIDLP